MLPEDPRNRYLLVLAVVAVSVLVVGWRLRPPKPSDSLSAQADISRLQRLTQRTNLENMATYFSEVAERVKSSLIWVEGLETPGIVWEQPGAILAAVPPIRAAAPAHVRGATDIDYSLLTDLYSETPEFRLLRAPPELPTVSLQITPAGALRQGSWLALIRRNGTETYEMESTLFSGTRAVRCGEVSLREMLVGLAADNRPLGAGAFDLEGRFFGVVLACDGVRRLITAESLGRA
ncbi:MAG: hypothetical protein KIT83_19240, partial [Bryobacterales bacterium]|nr:hypothetical protein [Bryobacterales bacterium]